MEAVMPRRIDDMPAGTIGSEAIGKVEDDDWEHEVEPVLRQMMADGGKARLQGEGLQDRRSRGCQELARRRVNRP
jgi:hypothetical protein